MGAFPSLIAVFFLRLARLRISRFILGWVLAHMSFLIPAERLLENGNVIAFYHPTPSYPLHILLVPKNSVESLLALPPESRFLDDLLEAVQILIKRFNLEQHGYRLITNGGPFQEVPQLHFHLISEQGVRPNGRNPENERTSI